MLEHLLGSIPILTNALFRYLVAPTISLVRRANTHGEKGKCLRIAWAMPHILFLILFLILILLRKRENR